MMNKNGLFDHLSYSVDQKSKFDAMFDITFNTSKCCFERDKSKNKIHFKRDTAIKNAEMYFQRLGINTPIYIKHEKEKHLYSKLIYKLISTELLPAIFYTDNSEGKQETKHLHEDDITANFTIAINNVKAVLESKNIVSILYRNAKMSDIETIYEKYIEDSQKESNLAICICTEDISELVYEPLFFEPSTRIYIAPKPYDIYNSKEADFSISIEQLKKLSILFPIDDEAAFDFPNYIYKKQSAVESITINCLKNTATAFFLPYYFYYVPRLENNRRECYKNNPSMLSSEVTVYQNMRRSAAEAIQEKYQAKFKKYYKSVLSTITTNIEILSSVDYGYLFKNNRCEKPKIEKALGKMWDNINMLYSVLYDGGYSDSEIKALIIWFIEYSVGMLNKAIEGIIAIPHRIGADKASSTTVNGFITHLRDYISDYDLRKFIHKIEGYFSTLHIIEELFEANNNDVCSRIEEIDAYISIDVKSDFNTTNKKLSEICLDESVFKKLHNSLIQLTNILKKQ